MKLNNQFFAQILFAFTVLAVCVSCGDDNGGDDPDPTSFTDSRDGQTYSIVTIGSQTWMGENLRFASPSAGTSACYDDNASNCTNFGRLYDFDAAVVACPNGWHLPTDDEWKTLERELGLPENLLDNTGTRGTTEGTTLIEGDFKAEKGGRQSSGVFVGLNEEVNYWTATIDPNNADRYFAREIQNGSTAILRRGIPIANKFCVRCLQN